MSKEGMEWFGEYLRKSFNRYRDPIIGDGGTLKHMYLKRNHKDLYLNVNRKNGELSVNGNKGITDKRKGCFTFKEIEELDIKYGVLDEFIFVPIIA